MSTEPTEDELREWWGGLSEPTRAALIANPAAAVDEDLVDEVMSYQNRITTFARWDRGLRVIHLRQATQDFIAALG